MSKAAWSMDYSIVVHQLNSMLFCLSAKLVKVSSYLFWYFYRNVDIEFEI